MMAESLEEPSFSESSGFEKYRSHQHFDVLFDELEALRGLLDTVQKLPEISLFEPKSNTRASFCPLLSAKGFFLDLLMVW